MPRRRSIIVAVSFALCVGAAPAQAQFPENLVSTFCDADGRGDRLDASRAAALGDFLGWRFEPAWDRLFLISGYEIRPETTGAEEVQLEIRYTVVAEITGEGVRDDEHIDAVQLTLIRSDGVWRSLGPPPAPHLYASAFQADKLFAQLGPVQPDYLSNSKLVWRLMLEAGWSYPYMTAAAYLGSQYFKPVSEPSVGDVVAYLVHGVPYHVGIYLGDDRVASATVRGVVRTPMNAFPGEVRYLRLTEAARPAPPAEEEAAPAPTPAPTALASPPPAG